ncbi:MAG: hypothetical protein QG599_1966 [Pseudomonadota bacterium]|nr:hypothetical protein [Pseudomonadota bacterium]
MRLRRLTVKAPFWRAVFFWVFSQIVVNASDSLFAAFSGLVNIWRVLSFRGFLGDCRRFEGETDVGW